MHDGSPEGAEGAIALGAQVIAGVDSDVDTSHSKTAETTRRAFAGCDEGGSFGPSLFAAVKDGFERVP